MPKQKFDKKNAAHFYVVHRSQRDELYNDPDASKFVLQQVNAPNTKTQKKKYQPKLADPRDQVDADGFKVDGYDYSQHMAPIRGGGVFIGVSGKVMEGGYAMPTQVELSEDMVQGKEGERMLESIALSTASMPSDLRRALEEDGLCDELDDDFITQATAAEGPGEGFDFDAHIARLMRSAAAAGGSGLGFGDSDEEFTDDEEGEGKVVDEATMRRRRARAQMRARTKRLVDERLEVVLRQYGEEEVGELGDAGCDPRTAGVVGVEDARVMAVMEQFLAEVAEVNEGGAESAMAGAMVAAEGEEGEEGEGGGSDDDGMEGEGEGEETLYVSRRRRKGEAWDCESVLSTLSTTDNLPTVLQLPSARRRRRRKGGRGAEDEGEEEGAGRIVLSRKTGMPVGVLTHNTRRQRDGDGDGDGDAMAALGFVSLGRANKGEARSRGESKAEKKARKAAVRAQRKANRQRKKGLKSAYKSEIAKQTAGQSAQLAGTSVLPLS